MTQEERIYELEKEISSLKEELRKNRKANIWNNVKGKFIEELESFNWIDEWSFKNNKGEIIEHNNKINETHNISSAIGTIVRVTLKKKRLNYLEENDEEKATYITKKILEIMENERRKNEIRTEV